MRSVALAALLALLLASSALAGGATQTSPLQPPIAHQDAEPPQLTEKSATQIFLAEHKVSDWLKRYPEKGRSTDATYDKKSLAWDVKVWWGKAGEIATGTRRRRDRSRPGGVDGPAGRVEDGARLLGRFRRHDDQQHLGLARLLRRLPARARRPAPAAFAGETST